MLICNLYALIFVKLQQNKNGGNKLAWCLLESAVGPICGAKFILRCILRCYTLYFSCYSSLFFPATVTELDFTILLCEYRVSHSVYCYCSCHAACYRLVFHCRLLSYFLFRCSFTNISAYRLQISVWVPCAWDSICYSLRLAFLWILHTSFPPFLRKRKLFGAGYPLVWYLLINSHQYSPPLRWVTVNKHWNHHDNVTP